jgi:hypothetical protein
MMLFGSFSLPPFFKPRSGVIIRTGCEVIFIYN